MSGHPEVLDGTTCLVPSSSVNLGNNEKLMATRIRWFKLPKISIPVLVVPGLNVNLTSCAQRRKQVMLAQNSWKPIHSGTRPAKGISHEVAKRHCPRSSGLAERLNLTIMDKVRCILIDTNLTPKLWTCAAHYAVLIHNNLPHSALDNHKSPSNAYEDSSDFSELYVFGSICCPLRPWKLLHKLEERSAKGLFLGIDPAGYKLVM
jgi:hypothetical protein